MPGAITDAAYAAWLASATPQRCVLIECTWRNLSTGAGGVEYLSTHPFVSGPADTPAHQRYRAIVKAIPSFKQTMSDFLYGVTTPNVGTVTLTAGDSAMDVWLDGSRDFIGRPVTVYLGDPSWPKADFRSIWSGVLASVGVSGTNVVTLEVRDAQHLLNQPIKRAAFTDLIYRGGSNYGASFPLTYGTVHRIPTVYQPIYTAPLVITPTYFVHDGPVQSIDAVYADGAPLPGASWTSYASAGYFTIPTLTNNSAKITADVRGAVDPVTGYFWQTPKEIGQQLIARSSLATIAQDWSRLDSKQQAPIGLAITSDPFTASDALDAIARTVGGYYGVSRDGALYFGRVDLTDTPTVSIGAQQIAFHGLTVSRVLQPRSSYLIAYDAQSPSLWQQTSNEARADSTYLSTSVDPDARAYIAKGFRVARYDNPNIANFAKTSRETVRATLFYQTADAYAEAVRLMGIFGTLRMILDCDCFMAPSRYQLGDTVTITHPRYGLASGRNGVIVGIDQNLSRRRVKLSVLV